MSYFVKPILFNTDMVRAILNGSKTQTRRLVKGIPLYRPYFEDYDSKPLACDENGDWFPLEKFSRIQPDDVLWVRETWKQAVTGTAGPGLIDYYLYKADEPQDTTGSMVEDRWHPSIHMPYSAARLFLRVKNVRVERLQDMTPYDCIHDGGFTPEAVDAVGVEALFKPLWNSTIKKINWSWCGWSANPWVWVIEFERINKENIYDAK